MEGEIRLKGELIRKPGPDRIMVFQEFDQFLPWKTVRRLRAKKVGQGSVASFKRTAICFMERRNQRCPESGRDRSCQIIYIVKFATGMGMGNTWRPNLDAIKAATRACMLKSKFVLAATEAQPARVGMISVNAQHCHSQQKKTAAQQSAARHV
jgi:hypothetical protein